MSHGQYVIEILSQQLSLPLTQEQEETELLEVLDSKTDVHNYNPIFVHSLKYYYITFSTIGLLLAVSLYFTISLGIVLSGLSFFLTYSLGYFLNTKIKESQSAQYFIDQFILLFAYENIYNQLQQEIINQKQANTNATVIQTKILQLTKLGNYVARLYKLSLEKINSIMFSLQFYGLTFERIVALCQNMGLIKLLNMDVQCVNSIRVFRNQKFDTLQDEISKLLDLEAQMIACRNNHSDFQITNTAKNHQKAELTQLCNFKIAINSQDYMHQLFNNLIKIKTSDQQLTKFLYMFSYMSLNSFFTDKL